LNPVSLKELSAHARSTRVAEIATAVRELGGLGIVAGVVTLAMFEYGENTSSLDARTR
jgi:hypothetical protein